MKKTVLLLLALALTFSLASCGTKTDADAGADEPPVTANDGVTNNEAGKTAEDDAAKRAEEETAKKAAEEEAAKKAEEEAAKKAAEEDAAKKAEEEAAKKAAEEEAARKAEEEAAKKAAEEEARKKAEEEAAKKAAEEEAARKAAEEAAKKDEEEQNTDEQEPPTPPSGGLIVPGFGGIGGLGGGSGSEDAPKAQLGDGSALVPVLENVLEGSTGDLTLDARALTDSDYWNITNWFPGLTMADGTKVAAATPGISSSAHAVILFEMAEGTDAEAFASELESHADPRWQICTAAESVQYKVCGSRILFVMSSAEIADAVIAAFNG